MQSRFGADFSGVRLHTGTAAAEAARAQRADAFTLGSDIFFAGEKFQPHTGRGRELLAHELAHVAQQQRADRGAMTPDRYRAAERDADRAAHAALAGQRAQVGQGVGHAIQRQGPDDAPAPVISSSPEFQLQLDPDIEAMMLQHYVRWWVGVTLTDGDAPDALDEPEAEAGKGGTAAEPVIESMPLAPDFFSPIAPDMLPQQPDWSSVMGPYNLRMVPYGTRDPDAVAAIYRQNWQFVSVLPDIRELAPGFIRPLIPTDWRASMANAFTAATVNAQLRHDYMTPLEAADHTFYLMTGVSTTYIPLPSISF